jgi:AcrR family transcriptional regulator
VSPRSYQLGRREPAVHETRGRILAAAREILGRPTGLTRFTVDQVALRAGVARATVYYQFKNKAGLVEALFDDLAARGGLRGLPEAFAKPDPWAALDEFIAIFVRFWSSDRLVIRRLRALAALEPELEPVARDAWRREGLEVILRRLGATAPDAIDSLQALTAFETYDLLATEDRERHQVAALIQRQARATLQPAPPSASPFPGPRSRGGGGGRRARSG